VPPTVGLRASASAKNSCVEDIISIRLRKVSTVVCRAMNVNTLRHFKILLGRSPFVVVSRNCLVWSEGIFGCSLLSLRRLSAKIYTLVQNKICNPETSRQ